MVEYACAAALEDGKTRCRRSASPGSQFCWQERHREGAPIAPPPDIILLKPKVSPKWFGMMADKIPLKSEGRSTEKIKEHIAQAEKLGRDPFTLRPGIEDSGTLVFRKQKEFVSLSELLRELLEEGYLLIDIHGRPARNQPMLTLTMGFSKEIDQVSQAVLSLVDSDLAKAVLGVILGSVWEYCHLWANPPNEQGRIVHTINLAHRQPGNTPAKKLRFAQGLWELE